MLLVEGGSTANPVLQCGLQRPQCSNCIKSNRLCTGYQRERVFIINQTVYTGTNGNRDSKNEEPEKEPNEANGSSALVVPIWKQKHKSLKPSTYVSLVPAYRQRLFDTYIRATVPDGSLMGPGFTSWYQELTTLPHHTTALTTALVALSLSKVAQIHNDQVLRTQSLEYYTNGLWDLQKALWSPEEMYLDQTLAACLLLAAYELFECPGGTKKGYIHHQDGAARLVQLRGPEAHVDGFGHTIFTVYRAGAILHALSRHQHTFLSEEKWMTIPYSVHPKLPIDKVWDIIAQVPGIFKQTDEMQRSLPVQSLSIAVHVLDYCWGVDAELEKWYADLAASVPGPLFWPELATGSGTATPTTPGTPDDDASSEPNPFPVAYQFINLRMAMILLSYWSLQTIVHNGMMLLYRVLETVSVDRKAVAALGSAAPAALLRGISPHCPTSCACGGADDPSVPCIARFDMSMLRPLGHRADVLAPVREICQSVEYCSQPHMLDLGWTSVVAPLSIAVETVREYQWCNREMEWARGVLRGFHGRLPYLKNMWY